jgi:hypothetical protein
VKKTMWLLAAAMLAWSLTAGCVFTPGPDYGDDMAPPLPSTVYLDSGPYYQHGNYHYRYEGERWHYSKDRNGPWRELPRSHWPKEVRHGGEPGRGPGPEHQQEHEHEHEHEHERR